MHVAKIGAGYAFVRELVPSSADPKPVINSNVDTPPNLNLHAPSNLNVCTESSASTLINKEEFRNKKEQQTAAMSVLDRSVILEEFAKHAPVPDDRALDGMIASCLSHVPDLTTQQLKFLVRQKGVSAQSSRTVENPAGFLLSMVPRACQGESFAILRRQLQAAIDDDARVRYGKAADEEVSKVLDNAPADNYWAKIAAALKSRMNPETYAMFVKPVRYLAVQSDVLVVVMPGEEWRHRLHGLGEEILAVIHDEDLPVAKIKFLNPEQALEFVTGGCNA